VRRRPALMVLFIAAVLLSIATSGLSQGKPSTPPLVSARQKYLGAKVRIKGPLESASPGLLAMYINWRVAKKDPHGRYHGVTPVDSARLPYGYERHQATIIAVQLSDAHELGPNFDFVVRFDDGVIGICTCSLKTVNGNFAVVAPKPSPQK
jgi:hypothetical protein